jgi:hypothetical protein
MSNSTFADMDGYYGGFGGGGGGGYGGDTAVAPAPTSSSARPPPLAPASQGKALLQAYRKDIMTGFEGEAPRYNPVWSQFVGSARRAPC